jgi:galactokinase
MHRILAEQLTRHRSIVDRVRKGFLEKYRQTPRIFRAPGRVNLIGEHTDHNDGFVMPTTIQFFTYVAVSPRDDLRVCAYSENYDQITEFDLDNNGPDRTGQWSDYVRGVAGTLREEGVQVRGANLFISGEIPIGSGLSSSAAITVASAFALLANSDSFMDRIKIARVCQQSEHNYVGTLCGIMDPFVSCFGQANKALLLDCRDLSYELVPMDEEIRVVVCNTKVHHQLARGHYNLRREECARGVQAIRTQNRPDISSLRDVTIEELERCSEGLPEVIYRRCRHVVTENARVQAAAVALKEKDMGKFGELMEQSHLSLRDDFEVSCKELNLMVDLARGRRGVYGARMTGGGFGGCTVNLVRADAVEEFEETIRRDYAHATGWQPDVYVCVAVDAAGAAPEEI